ncbi:MAG: ArsA family ATPase [Candidatus Hydrothermarchaeota archaeon]
MPLKDLLESKKRLILFGGKGGVGKTTCAAATALQFASHGRSTLIISSDPTPSLSDIFETRIGDKEKRIRDVKNLHAVEISSDIVLERWKKKFGPEIHDVISSFIPVEYDFIEYIGKAPGIDEEFMLDYILELVENEKYDTIVWDTAPAGHTLRLLTLPTIFIDHLEEASNVYLKLHGYFERIRKVFGLNRGKRSPLDIIEGWKGLAEEILNLLKDKNKTEFVIVTIPEALGVYQTERLIDVTRDFGLRINHMIVNNVIKDADCDFHIARKEMQKKYIEFLEEKYGESMSIVYVYLYPHEIKGVERIMEVSQSLFSNH